MNHEEEFLQQIRAAPEDDELRLVYADWLEERGDPRGEFIRIQCELAEIDPYAAMSSEEEYDRRDELLEREGDLRIAHEEQWTASLKDYVRVTQFRRGMIEYVEADAEAIIEHAPAIFEQAPILLMTVTRSRRNLKELVDIEGVQRLRGLALDGSFLQEEDLVEIVRLLHFKQLHGLSMSRCALDSEALDPLKNLTASELRQLDLSSNHLRNPAAAALAACSGLPRLEVLNLAHNEIRFNGARSLKNSSELQSLRQVIVKGNPLEQRAIDALRSRYDQVVI